jgi:hypothetical protein
VHSKGAITELVAAGRGAVEQGDEGDEAFGGTNPRGASGARPELRCRPVAPPARRTRAPLRS